MPLLEVKNLKVHFPVKHGLFSRVQAYVKAVDDVSFTIRAGRDAGAGGRERLRQDDAGPRHRQAGGTDGGQHFVRGRGHRAIERRGIARAAAEVPDDFPGPVQLAESAHDGRADHRRGAGHSSSWRKTRAARQKRIAELLQSGGAGRGARAAVSARIQRRAAAAHRHRARAGGGAEVDCLRRAGERAGCFGAGADHQSAAGFAARSGAWPICSSRTIWRWWSTSAGG